MGDNSSYNVIEIRSKADANQYFLIENRQLVGYDAGLEKWNDSRSSYQFDGGIVIWHIDGSVFKVNNNNSHKHHFMQIEQSIPDDIDGIQQKDIRRRKTNNTNEKRSNLSK